MTIVQFIRNECIICNNDFTYVKIKYIKTNYVKAKAILKIMIDIQLTTLIKLKDLCEILN